MQPVTDATARATEEVLEAENFIETYKLVADWIRFADTKAAATLTVNGVLLGLMIPTLKSYLAERSGGAVPAWWLPVVVMLFLAWLLTLVASASYSFLCILPFRGLGRQMALAQTTHFHPAAIAQKFPLGELDRFVAECQQIGMTGLKREVIAALLIDAHLSNAKYRYVTRSVVCLAVSVVFGFGYLIAIQF
jgi:hypothetical protein